MSVISYEVLSISLAIGTPGAAKQLGSYSRDHYRSYALERLLFIDCLHYADFYASSQSWPVS